MKRRMTLSLMLTLSLLSLTNSAPTAHGQPPQRFRADSADSGVITPSPDQVLRVTVAPGFRMDDVSVRFLWAQYGPQGCSGTPAVCRHMIVSQGTTPVQTPGPADALSFDIPGNGNGTRIIVESNSANIAVDLMIIDSITGEVRSFRTSLNTLGDGSGI